jgi:glyoxylase-like metal-dependent hydrolase (beta-lactamase superfamily II)
MRKNKASTPVPTPSPLNIINVGYDSTNYYVLSDKSPKLMIDTGWPGTLTRLQAQCKRVSLNLTDIPYLLITHYHPDHAGLAQELKRLGIKLIMLEHQAVEVPRLKRHMKADHHYQEITLNDNVMLRLEDSREFLAKSGIAGEIISTPGHSDDSVTLILDQGAAFTGDLTHPMLSMGEPDDPATLSWAKIRAAGGTTIYPGHGPVWKLGSEPGS